MAEIEAIGIKTFEADAGRRLVLAIEDAGIDILHRCGGLAKCTTCRVEIVAGDPGQMNEAERARLAREGDLAPNTRLACQVLVAGNLRLNVLRRLSETDMSDAGPRPTEELPALG